MDNRYYLEDRNNPKKKFIEAHSQVTAMLRVPGFQKTYQTQGADLFSSKHEVSVIFSNGITYTTGEIVAKLNLSIWEIEQYRDDKEWYGVYAHKKNISPFSYVRIITKINNKHKKEEGEIIYD